VLLSFYTHFNLNICSVHLRQEKEKINEKKNDQVEDQGKKKHSLNFPKKYYYIIFNYLF